MNRLQSQQSIWERACASPPTPKTILLHNKASIHSLGPKANGKHSCIRARREDKNGGRIEQGGGVRGARAG
jgi:hypothetical protein